MCKSKSSQSLKADHESSVPRKFTAKRNPSCKTTYNAKLLRAKQNPLCKTTKTIYNSLQNYLQFHCRVLTLHTAFSKLYFVMQFICIKFKANPLFSIKAPNCLSREALRARKEAGYGASAKKEFISENLLPN